MKITLCIRRFNPDTDKEPYYQNYSVHVEPTDRLLDALIGIKERHDSTLCFRKSCAHGVCGSDAMRINGKDRLACKTLIRDVADREGAVVLVEPLRHFPVSRDLMVDQSVFFDKYRSVKPYLINEEPVVPRGERIQQQAQRDRFDDATNCILCCACYSACPVLDTSPEFLGPAAIVQAFRFIEDSRDLGFEQRLASLDRDGGVWACRNHFECTRSCPRGIKVTRHINKTKHKIDEHKKSARNSVRSEVGEDT